MGTVALTKDSFVPTVLREDIVLVDFSADRGAPCRTFTPVFQQASEQHPDICFAEVDTEAEPDLAGAAGISSIPTLIAFRDAIPVFTSPGALSPTTLERVIAAIRALDMEEVHRRLAEYAASAATAS